MNAGYYEEARGLARLAAARRRRQPAADADHVRHRRRAAPDGVGGRRGCPATRAPRPVRIGNAAHSQLQLDVYGEVMDALHAGAARRARRASDDGWAVQRALLEHLETRLDASPTRASGRCAAPPRHFTHSKVMAWVAFDRAIKSAEQFGARRAGRALARAARRDPRRRLPNAASTASSAASCSPTAATQLDASLLLLPLGRLPAAATIRACAARSRRSSGG